MPSYTHTLTHSHTHTTANPLFLCFSLLSSSSTTSSPLFVLFALSPAPSTVSAWTCLCCDRFIDWPKRRGREARTAHVSTSTFTSTDALSDSYWFCSCVYIPTITRGWLGCVGFPPSIISPVHIFSPSSSLLCVSLKACPSPQRYPSNNITGRDKDKRWKLDELL